MIEICTITGLDYECIQRMAHQTWPHTFGNIISDSQLTYMLEMMYSIPSLTEQTEKKGHTFLIARDGGMDAGFASYELNYRQERKTKIHKLYVLPSAQGRGAGKLLIDRIAAIARENHNNVLTLNVNRHNKAVQFYEKTGFVKTGEEDISIGNGYLMEDFIMEKLL